MSQKIHVTVWNENRHEQQNEAIAKIYPEGMHGAIAKHLRTQPDMEVQTATLDEPDHGLTDEVIGSTDVMTWWGHIAHHEVKDGIVDKVHARVLDGMGLVVLHSGHFSKIFRKLMGTTCDLKWREIGERERLWVVEPGHPIASGIGEQIVIEHAEMYGERFDIPAPDTLVFLSWFQGGEVFRSGCCYHRGNGKIFYFRPGHETYPIFYQEDVLRVIVNGIRWAAPVEAAARAFGNRKPLEDVPQKPKT